MSPGSRPLDAAQDEIAALIETLHGTERRLEELTAGEVDSVTDRHGVTILLRHAQEQLRDRAAARQSDILNALPAQIALLDSQGFIVSVNEAWHKFGTANSIQNPSSGIGLNYLQVCDGARGEGSLEAHGIAAGIRRVLAGDVKRFSMEYPCHSPTQQRWFLMTAIPLAEGGPPGVVVTHLDVTLERQAEEKLRVSESRFQQMAESIREVFFLIDVQCNQVLYVSPAFEDIWGYSRDGLYTSLDSWINAIHPDDRAATYEKFQKGIVARKFELDYRTVRPDGSIRWIEARAFPVPPGGTGEIIRIAGIAKDVTERALASASLLESRQRLELATESAHIGIWVLDAVTPTLIWDRQMFALYGVSRTEFSGAYDAWQKGLHPDDRARAEAELAAALQGVSEFHTEFRVVWPSGEVRDIEAHALVQRADDGSPKQMVGVNWDITARKQAETRIRYLNRVYAMLSGINTMIFRVRDRDDLFREACRITIEEGGFLMSLIAIVDPITMKIVPVASAGKNDELLAAVKKVLSSSDTAAATMVARAILEKKAAVSNHSESDPRVIFGAKYAESGVRSMAVMPLLVADEAVGVLALYAREREFFHAEEMKLLTELAGDIAFAMDHIGKQERLDYLAYYDSLTGLANRKLFIERVALYARSAISSGRKIAMFLIDVERFKNINDSFGRPAGDALLRQLAEWLTVAAGDPNLLARMGADQFAMVLPEIVQEGEIVQLLETKMDALLAHSFQLQEVMIRIAVKVGIALFPDDGDSADMLFRNAEVALKMAKQGGDRYLFYAQKMNESVAGRVTMEYQLRQALDRQEFVLHYQPKVVLASGQLAGVEALIRWQDPRTGLVPPGRFISILEETGLIHEVGRWALRAATEDYLRWSSAGLAAVRIAVNVSPLQLRNRDFVADIERLIASHPKAAAGLELEITESVIMENVERSIASLHVIRALGISLAIDDFGTGFSSLSALARLPVDTLKIDRSFVNTMSADAQGLALVTTIISLAHSLRLKVVAEGVETDEQLRLLRSLDCDEFQGFLCSKPLPREQFEQRFLMSPHAMGCAGSVE